MLTKAPKGTKDLLPQDSYKWQFIEKTIREVCAAFAFKEIRTPVFEHTELFARGVGDTTDIVQKEMYTFLDKGGRSITLKPEGTAGVARSFIENSLYADAQPTKLYYLSTPVFRYENPQAGRLREHHQFGVEVFGAAEASIDAEIISIALTLFKKLGIKGLKLNINSIGCSKCRPDYNQKLKEYFNSNKGNLCKTCRERLNKNPLRILDCKEESCAPVIKNAPVILECLCEECQNHFEMLKGYLESLGISYSVNPYIVRGLDYYEKTVFEIISTDIGAQGTVCGGGRYDGLIEQLGGPKTPGIGFGLGIERLLIVMESQGIAFFGGDFADVYICTQGDEAKLSGFKMAQELRDKGISTETDHMGRSMKAQFKYANKIGAKYVIVIGGDELKKGVVKLRDMKEGNEREINSHNIIKELSKIFNF
ncbi:MAG: histidine--tRNA ligase [Eubacteriales bacterium]